MPSSNTNIKFENHSVQKPDLSILSHIYFYNGGVVAIGDINNVGLLVIYFTSNSKGNYKLYLHKGNFEDMTENACEVSNAD